MPAASCTDLARMSPHFESGVYWLQPSDQYPAFQVLSEYESRRMDSPHDLTVRRKRGRVIVT